MVGCDTQEFDTQEFDTVGFDTVELETMGFDPPRTKAVMHGRARCRSRRGRALVAFCSVVPLLFVSLVQAQGESVRVGHDYRLQERSVQTVAVELTDRGFDWPGLSGDFDTALLEIDVRARSPRRSLPWLQASAGQRRLSQHFQRGARGLRYLNLSELRQGDWPAEGDAVGLEGWKLDWMRGSARLHLFETPRLENARVLVVAPHPDDAEIAAFGVYASTRADVVTVTAGDAGGMNFSSLYSDSASHYRAKGWIRTLDSLLVPQIGGVAPSGARNLGFFDATLHLLFESPDQEFAPPYAELESPSYFRRLNSDPMLSQRPFVGSWRGLVADLRAELDRVRPDFVVLPHPHLDAHRDHQYTAIALLEALQSTELDPTLLLYTNHAVGAERHPFGPRNAVASLPPWHGAELPFDGVFSFSLSQDLQRSKLFALEAMHDLRSFEIDGPAPPRTAFREWMRSLRRSWRKHQETYSYYRRAARPNEIFLVAGRATANEIRRSFLARAETQ